MLYRRTVTDSGLLKVLLLPQESELGREGGVRDEGGDQRMAASPSDCSAWVGLGGGTHPQKKSMATSPARRMAKRMERMVVMAIMPGLCPLPVAEMVLLGLAGERAGGEGAAAGIHPRSGSGGRDGGRCVCVCHHTVPPYRSETRGTALPHFPQMLTGAKPTVAHHSAPWDHATRPGPPHIPPRRLWAGWGAGRAPQQRYLLSA